MALSSEQINLARQHLDDCKRPMFFFDDDQDGLCSFLQLYKYKKKGRGFIVKTTPKITVDFLKHVKEYNPDKVFILDIAMIDQEFLDEARVPVVWIDHHGPFERRNVNYFNPRTSKNDNHPTSYLCYQIARQEIWLAAVGCVADWFLPPFLDDFKKQFPDIIETDYKMPGDIIYNTKLGELIKIFSFVLKGKSSDVTKNINILTRIKTPYEILNQQTSQGKYILKKFRQVEKIYQPLIKEVLGNINETKDKFVHFIYQDDKTSFTSDLSNEAIYRNHDKIILIGREKNGEMKCSIRSTGLILPPLVEKALEGLDGYGGGHERACGLNIKKEHFDEFVERFRKMVD